ncbi:hypothetical protein CONPUDRAFT_70786 [Coniophora puteana RWD-64-598 SS2]|uniref:Uncharacterized protein n=1 Tax=Coniophora puteana (strain RWD-64-598) TaxID=741705 RepID=A0A5M3MYZ3_CONPW|nr:uncharacterized protein CONPUDRAFT_70786 [Coniophora puteana RWD-64-598 SS2]EIW83865.1 hypothetical protein CONPUDRAFT_70786 [Coniophora puteana RWD-64-598 SS2]
MWPAHCGITYTAHATDQQRTRLMVHARTSGRETYPNPYISFISVLPTGNTDSENYAWRHLRSLAASEVKPVMKQHGFIVNGFEEYRYSKVFAAYNWNILENCGKASRLSASTGTVNE